MNLTIENIWKGVIIVSVTSLIVILLTSCATVKSGFSEITTEFDADGLITSTTETIWDHKAIAAPFGKIDEAQLQTSYEIIDAGGGSQTIMQGQEFKGMDNSGNLEALKAGLATVANIGNLLAPMLTAPKPVSTPKPTLPKIIEEIISNAPPTP